MIRWLSLRRYLHSGRRTVVLAYAALALSPMPSGAMPPAVAGELDGVAMPDLLQAAGTPLWLNGMGLRTYTLFRIHIYVAGLYLQQKTSDADAILRSETIKLLDIRFVHDADAGRVRGAWAKGFRENCRPPCRLPESLVTLFLSSVPDFRKGDQSVFLFRGHSVEISVNGRVLGSITDPTFTRTILATFIGADPPTEPFKHGLLGLHN